MKEKRKSERKNIAVTTIIRKQSPGGGSSIMEFQTRDASFGGIFIYTEDLSIFDLGDEVEILVDDSGMKYYEGKARVVRSERGFAESGDETESGYGLMFLEPTKDFQEMLKKKLSGSK